MKRRIFIESDVLNKEELSSVEMGVRWMLEENNEPFIKGVFDEALDFAWHDLEKTWKSVKNADEIYADSSLMPLVGNSYMGAPVIFNGMMERAISENVKGKDVIILRPLKQIYWDMIDLKLIKKAFKHNRLFMYDDNHDKLIQVDISATVKEQRNK